jgi:hypothetical protein
MQSNWPSPLRNSEPCLTHNRVDFEALATDYFQTGTIHYGIIIARRHPPYELSRRILVLLNQVTADEMVDQLRYI